jgi:hypothetical protein
VGAGKEFNECKLCHHHTIKYFALNCSMYLSRSHKSTLKEFYADNSVCFELAFRLLSYTCTSFHICRPTTIISLSFASLSFENICFR